MVSNKEELLTKFNYYCDTCSTPFDKLPPSSLCPFCDSTEITYKKNTKKISKRELIQNYLAKTCAGFLINIFLFLKKEKNSFYLLTYFILLSFLFSKLFNFNNFTATMFSLLFIIVRRK